MTWYTDDYDAPFDDEPLDVYAPDRDEPPGRLRRWIVGTLIVVITLVLIAALLATTLLYLQGPRRGNAGRQVSPPSPADLRNANYRPSTWQAGAPVQYSTPTPLPPDLVSEADAEYLLLTNLYERVNPSVVNIETVSSFHTASNIVDSSGSGFVLDTEGHIVTNAHVVRDASDILVTFYDGFVSSARLVAFDDYSDLAVIRVDPTRAPLIPVELGDSNTLKVGQRVVAIGNPFGLEGSMTVGIVSALGRSLPSAELLDPAAQPYSNPSIIQIDASVNPGNSGGPLLDSYGRVVGINTAIRSESGVFQGIAFAVPVNTVRRVVPQLIEKGSADYSWLGISSLHTEGGYSVAALADELGFPVRSGILISEITPGSPAARAGLRGGQRTARVRGVDIPVDGDIVVAINGFSIRDIDDLVAYLVENTSPGDRVVLTIVREGETLDLDVTLGVRP